MKRSFKTNRRFNQNIGIIKSNEKLIILIFSFIVGIIFGSLTLKSGDGTLGTYLKNMTESSYQTTFSQSIIANTVSCFLPDFSAVLLSAIFGLSVIGEPIIWFIPFVRGLGIGLKLGYIYGTFKIGGLLYAVVYIILPSVISILAVIIACKENILTSREIRSRLSVKETSYEEINYKLIALRNIITTLMILAASLITGLLVRFAGSVITLPI